MVVQFIMRMRQVMKISIHSRVWDMVLKKKRNDANFGSVQGAIYNKNDQTVEIGQDVGNR